MGDTKNPAIRQALKDFDDHAAGYDKVASKAQADDALAKMLSEQGTLLSNDPRGKLQGATNDQLVAVIRDVAVMMAHLGAGVLALRKAVELLAKDMPSSHHRTATDALFDSRH